MIKFFWMANLLLAVGFIIFKLGRVIVRKRADYQTLTRVAQVLLFVSLLAPGILSLIPQKSLPVIAFRAPLPESDSARVKFETGRPAVNFLPATSAAPPLSARLESYVRNVDSHILMHWLLWAATGVGLLAGLGLLRNLMRLHALVRESSSLRSLGRVQVVVSEQTSVPFSLVLGRWAYVVLPLDILARTGDLRVALRHELEHHRRRDTLWAHGLELLRCAFVLNPAVYLWKKELTELQEFSCDEALIVKRRVSSKDYGSCLLRVAEAALSSREQWAGTACMATGSFLRRRVEMLKSHEGFRSRKRLGVILGTTACCASFMIAYGAQQVARAPERRALNPGQVIVDATIQDIASRALRRAVERHRAVGGFVIVSEPATGRLLAVANETSDPQFAQNPNWALGYPLEPASIIKAIVAAAALEQGVVGLDDVHNCEKGKYQFGKRVYHDHKDFDHLTTAESVIHSSNICGIKIGEKLDAKGLYRALGDFGFGPGGTGAEFPQSMPGEFPQPGDLPREDYIPLVSTGFAGLGNFYATPLEIVQAMGTIANGGVRMKPVLLGQGPVVAKRVLSEENAKKMRGVLARVVTEGTGETAKSAMVSTAGKTSTAYSPKDPEQKLLGGEWAVAGFVGFAPVEQARFVVYAAVIQPKDKRVQGRRHAAPLFKDVVEGVLGRVPN